mmetsp:Transcript_8691/g.21195  ORF Transcript_8691/g.21195 Transcript_8691/m.21195 type:complete len:779 (+) Transcript_8691:97-2433(+)|eukprot:CAMPEP_0197194388 /NCGR_PEP_ID=MMETSP1423-20130617/29161_1 /TAXON_ID=476441 /ORGANISM="Pseudo-nitzschia heimii, Strain UNC1101" /LENGTH=778 /DNA_ID=CAMNT_0042647807 /DNA_START=43 /DNA_END=2379 /DNA_ORIENTATION=-
MAYVLDQSNSEDETGRKDYFEAELKLVRNAFKDYVATTEGLEGDVKKELRNMQRKLNQATSANEELVEKLKNSEGLLRALRHSSEATREKLKSEMKLRRELEKALTESELESRSKTTKIKQLERNDVSMLTIVDSGIITEMANNTSKRYTQREFKTDTDDLKMAEKKYQKAEQKLRKSQRLVQDLEGNENIGSDTANYRCKDDKDFLQGVDKNRADIDAGRSYITSPTREHFSQYEIQLEENREEKTRLMEEISRLRNILRVNGIIEGGKVLNTGETNSAASIQKRINETKRGQHSEIEYLRNQVKKLRNENMNLQENLNVFDNSISLMTMSTAEKSKLEDEVHRLKDELQLVQQTLNNTLNEKRSKNQIKENEKIDFDSEGPVETLQDAIIGVKFGMDLTPDAEDLVIGAKFRQSQRMLEEAHQECSRMRDEILSITESLYHANQNRGVIIASNEVVCRQNELEDKQRQTITLEKNLTCAQEEVRLLCEEISYMTTAFEKAHDEYNSVVEELQQTESALAAAKDVKVSQFEEITKLELVAEKTPHKNAEISLLRTQFEKLKVKNEKLSRQIKDAECEILNVRENQDNIRKERNVRVHIAKQLQENVDHVVCETHQRNLDVEELALMMENRMQTTEEKLKALQSEIALALRNLRTTELTQHFELISQEEASLMDNHPVKKSRSVAEIHMDHEAKPSHRSLQSSDENCDKSKISWNLFKRGGSGEESQLKENDGTTTTNLLQKSKYDLIIQRVAKYQPLSIKEDREHETRGDNDVVERE